MNSSYPRVLRVDSTYTSPLTRSTSAWDATLDLSIYEQVPQSWRKLEVLLRLDLLLAMKVKQVASAFDVILAGSERVGLPLAALRLKQPIVTIAFHMGSKYKKRFLRPLGLQRQWQRVGCLSVADQQLMSSFYGVPREKLFRYIGAPLDRFAPGRFSAGGPIMSVGVSKRDYGTLLKAVARLPHCQTEIYSASRYPDKYKEGKGDNIPDWVSFKEYVPLAALAQRYRSARFVVVPLLDTTQFSAGATTALEAHAAGKAVIATRTQGMVDYVVDGKTGILVPPGDVEALARAIAELWDNPERAHQMGLAGRQYVEANFDPTVAYEGLRRVLNEVHLEMMASKIKDRKRSLESAKKI